MIVNGATVLEMLALAFNRRTGVHMVFSFAACHEPRKKQVSHQSSNIARAQNVKRSVQSRRKD
jgi:hypothetical protein